MVEEKIERLNQLSLEKKELLAELLDRTKEQKELLLDGEDLDPLADILSAKREIMDRIDGLDLDFLESYEAIKKELGINSFEDIKASDYRGLEELQDLTSRISVDLKTLMDLDRENTNIIEKSMAGVKSDLKSVKNAQTAYKGYNQKQVGSILMDERK